MPPTIPLLSLGFAHPAMLAWGVAIALPILIHLWRRRHAHEEPWGPMRLLEEAIGRSRRRLQIERGFLLLLRIILILLLVLAVAEPVSDTCAATSLTPDARVHRIIVIDGSFSMAYHPTDRSRFEQAKEIVQRIVKSGQQGDGYSLLLAGSPTETIIADPVFETNRFGQVVDQLRQPDMTLDEFDMLLKAKEVLLRGKKARHQFDRTEIYFLTDLCRVGWKLHDKNCQGLAATLSNKATLVVIDLGQTDTSNSAITSLTATPSAAVVGQPVELNVAAQHFGKRQPQQNSLELLVDDRTVKRETIRFDKEGHATATFTYTFLLPGLHSVEMRLQQADQLEVDNRRFLIVPVQEAVKVLLVEGQSEQGTEADRQPTTDSFLKTALESSVPNETHQTFLVDTIQEGRLAETNLATYNTVLLSNIAQLTATEARMLKQYVEQGGELILFLGDQVMPDRYHRALDKLLPAKLGETISFDTPPKLDPLDYRHPIVQPFQSHPESGLLTIPIRHMVSVSIENHPKTETALATQGKHPIIVEHRVGAGRVILVTTSADTSWTLAPIWPSFVPLVQKMASLGYESNSSRLNITVSEPITDLIDSLSPNGRSETLDQFRFLAPDGQRLPLELVPKNANRWYFNRTEIAGIYELQDNGKETPTQRFAVNVDPRESNLAKLSKATLQNDIWPGVRFIYRTPSNETAIDTATDLNLLAPRGNPKSRRLLCFALLLLVLETCWITKTRKNV